MSAYVFLCSDYTEKECLRENLLGGTEKYASQVKKVNKGDTLFLYNYTSQKLHGIFTATSDSSMNINKDAWGGYYPWQVKVEKDDSKPLSRIEFDGVLFFDGKKGFPRPRINLGQLERLLFKFHSNSRITKDEEKYFRDNPAQNKTQDGHFVRSKAEVIIDDWLFNHRISHVYEKPLLLNESVICDFYIPFSDDDGIYIEYWGMDDEKYIKRKKEKQTIYDKYGLKLIELNEDDLNNLDYMLMKLLVE